MRACADARPAPSCALSHATRDPPAAAAHRRRRRSRARAARRARWSSRPWCSRPAARRSTAWTIPSSSTPQRREALYRSHRRSARWPGTSCSSTSRRSTASTSSRRRCSACAARSRAWCTSADTRAHRRQRLPRGLPCPAEAWIGGDARDRSIMAASILAKVVARPHMLRTARAMAAVRLRRAQGLLDPGAPGRAGHARPLPAPPAQFRAGACGIGHQCSGRRFDHGMRRDSFRGHLMMMAGSADESPITIV